jgi:AcrR family transcriptional regulator
MSTLSRKQREIAEREELILDVARSLLLERGYLGMTMERIAQATEYSKGTIYQHFANKEEILGVLTVRTLERNFGVFGRAFAFDGRPRERMAAIGESYELRFRLEPQDFALCEHLASPSLRAKIPESRLEQLAEVEARPMQLMSRIIEDGVRAGDLELPRGMTPAHICFGLWALHDGAFKIIGSGIPIEDKGIQEPFQVLREQAKCLMDGLGWRPLSSEHDYESTYERIRQEVFPDEFQRTRIHGP